jgi:diguanylate cyclase (GGDEF)-like protein
VFDINNLKVVNDKFGHEYGNKLIVSSANAIVAIFGEENTYRIGGDEFAVIIENEDDQIVKQLIGTNIKDGPLRSAINMAVE